MPTPKAGYFLDDGGQVPGCTTILGCLSTGPADPLIQWGVNLARQGKDFRAERERSAQVGTAIHDALEHYDKMPERPIWADDQEWERIRKAHADWVNWLSEYQPEIVAQEKQLVSKVYRAGGTFDVILRWKGRNYVSDFKSGKTIDRPKVCAQLAFYGHAATECLGIDIQGGLILHFPPKGKLKVIELTMEDLAKGIALFKSAREAYDAIHQLRRAA